MNLSKRIIILPDSNDLDDELKTAKILRVKDVREFIGELKSLLEEGKTKDVWDYDAISGDFEGLMERINKLAGKDLIGK